MKEKLWTKDFWAITIISFIIFFVFYVLLTLLPIYISDRLHAS
ncbi:MFS transporter, partial [Escherichia coli]|nr:MFS transporter [Escherichia coli]